MSTDKENTMSNIEALTVLGDELSALEAEIARLRLRRETLMDRLEKAVRERDSVSRHLASLAQNESTP